MLLFSPKEVVVSQGLADFADIELNGVRVTLEPLESMKPLGAESGPAFLGGGCLASSLGYARAAAAIAQVDSDGCPVTTITCCIPADWEQTAAGAEHLAAAFF